VNIILQLQMYGTLKSRMGTNGPYVTSRCGWLETCARCQWDLRSSGVLRSVDWWLVTDVLGTTYWTDRLYRNVGTTYLRTCNV